MLNADQIGYVKIASGIFVLGMIGALASWVVSIQPDFDEHLCRTDAPIPGEMMLVTDLSERDDKVAIPAMVRTLREDLPIYHRLSVYGVADVTKERPESGADADIWPLVLIFEACNPGRADQVNPLIHGTRVAQKKYETMFSAPLEAAVAAAAAEAGKDSSPILSALSRVTETRGWSGEGNRTLFVRSDFLEYTPAYSQYRGIGSVGAALAKTGATIPELEGVGVRMHYVQREKYLDFQTDEHVAFWKSFFDQARADLSVIPVEEQSSSELASPMQVANQ